MHPKKELLWGLWVRILCIVTGSIERGACGVWKGHGFRG